MAELPIDKKEDHLDDKSTIAGNFQIQSENGNNSPTRSLGASSLFVESDLEKLRFKVGDWKVSLGVVVGVELVLWGSGSLRPSEFHLRCLLIGSLFPTAA